jgi:hypothetical protein
MPIFIFNKKLWAELMTIIFLPMLQFKEADQQK